jgi:predicted nuclease with TOPRIM domain
MSEFLENLKKAADNGEFNSEAAKKILEINELADTKIGDGSPKDLEKLKESLEKRVKEAGEVKAVREEEALELNSEYEKKMEQIKKLDMVNAQLATLIEIEDMVKASVEDMFSFTDELETRFEKEFVAEDPMFGDLFQKIEELKSKYNAVIN